MVNDTGLQKIPRCCAIKTLTPKRYFGLCRVRDTFAAHLWLAGWLNILSLSGKIAR
jgi:hypothetical protein